MVSQEVPEAILDVPEAILDVTEAILDVTEAILFWVDFNGILAPLRMDWVRVGAKADQ